VVGPIERSSPGQILLVPDDAEVRFTQHRLQKVIGSAQSSKFVKRFTYFGIGHILFFKAIGVFIVEKLL